MPPQIHVHTLQLAVVRGVPSNHPEHATFEPFPVHGFAIEHPDGLIVVDTGIGFGNEFIDELYPHEATAIVSELHRCGLDERDIRLVVNSHLHFDHCGQNNAFACPVAVQRDELTAAEAQFYTVPDWARIEPTRRRALDGDDDIASGVRVMHTPGHTPGHQSVVVGSGEETIVIAAQCLFRRTAWESSIETSNLHDESWRQAAEESVRRLREQRPTRVLLSHDAPLDLRF
jgi:N-acyl homoserine lactone hydrolase